MRSETQRIRRLQQNPRLQKENARKKECLRREAFKAIQNVIEQVR